MDDFIGKGARMPDLLHVIRNKRLLRSSGARAKVSAVYQNSDLLFHGA
jgi:hypothetical protein